MPRSQNRRYLEIPAALYDALREQADAEQRTVAQIAADLIIDGQTVREYLVEIQTQLREIRREIAELRREQVAHLAQPHTARDASEGSPERRAPGHELIAQDTLH